MLTFQQLLLAPITMTVAFGDLSLLPQPLPVSEPASQPAYRVIALAPITPGDLVVMIGDDEPPLGERDPKLCRISPGLMQNGYELWSDRPIFLWQGESGADQIRVRNAANPDQILWSQPLNSSAQSAVYNGDRLTSGQRYQWQLQTETNDKQNWINFRIMSAERRSQITAGLQAIDAQRASGATPEAIALQKAKFLIEQKLTSDALQVMASVQKPSPELTQALHSIRTYLCPAPRAD